MKITKKFAIAAASATVIGGLGISAGIALAAPAAAQNPAPAKTAPAKAAPAHAAAEPNRPAIRKTNQWVTVRAGQTLKEIAAAHHMSWKAIYATPPNTRYLRDHATLAPGVRLRLPADPQLRKAEYVTMERRAAARREAARDRAAAAAAAAAAAPKPAAQAQPAAASQPVSAGMSAFEQCVAYRESGDNPTASSAGLFGILPATWQSLGYPGTAGQSSVALQKAAFAKLYAQDGTAPWAPYDGC